MQQRLSMRSKLSGYCLMVAAASTIREMRSCSEVAFHCHFKQSLDWTGQANGLACQVIGPYTSGLFPVGSHCVKQGFKPCFTHCQLILKRILLSASLRQQQTSGSNLAFSSVHISLCSIVVGCVSRLVAVHMNMCCNLV